MFTHLYGNNNDEQQAAPVHSGPAPFGGSCPASSLALSSRRAPLGEADDAVLAPTLEHAPSAADLPNDDDDGKMMMTMYDDA